MLFWEPQFSHLQPKKVEMVFLGKYRSHEQFGHCSALHTPPRSPINSVGNVSLAVKDVISKLRQPSPSVRKRSSIMSACFPWFWTPQYYTIPVPIQYQFFYMLLHTLHINQCPPCIYKNKGGGLKCDYVTSYTTC